MTEERCERCDMLIGLGCACQDGQLNRVWVTRGGSAYHRVADCEWLLRGQRDAHRKGLRVHPITSTHLQAVELKRAKCEHCYGTTTTPRTADG